MKEQKRILIVFCLLGSFLINAQTSSWGIVEQMGRGINLGNTLSAPVEGNWAPVVYEQYFIDVADAGFSNVRIPMDFLDPEQQAMILHYGHQMPILLINMMGILQIF